MPLSAIARADAVVRSRALCTGKRDSRHDAVARVTGAALQAASEARLAASDARIATPGSESESALLPHRMPSGDVRRGDTRGIPSAYSERIRHAAASRRAARIGRHAAPPAGWSLSTNASRIVSLSPESMPPEDPQAPSSPPSTRSDVSRRYYVADVRMPWGEGPPRLQSAADSDVRAGGADAGGTADGTSQDLPAPAVQLARESPGMSSALAEAEAAADALLRSDSQRSVSGLCEPEQPTRTAVRPPLPRRPPSQVPPPAPLAGDANKRGRAHDTLSGLAEVQEAASNALMCNSSETVSEPMSKEVSETEVLRGQVRKLEHTVAVLRAQISARDQTIAQLEEELAERALPPPSAVPNPSINARAPPASSDATPSGVSARAHDDSGVAADATSNEGLFNRLAAIKARWAPSPTGAVPIE